MELLDYYDEKNEKKLGVLEREEIHKNRLWHREASIWILNEKNELLLQRRSMLKSGANKFSITAGHIGAGEEEIKAALRELKEEIGIDAIEKDLILLDIYKNEQNNNNCFSYTYLLKTNKKIEDMTIQEEEVSELKYITIEELEKRLDNMDPEINFVGKPLIRYALDKIKTNYLNKNC
jgi:isopentenyldiphosphate isomerase